MKTAFIRLLTPVALAVLLLTSAVADTVEALDGSGTLLETLPMDDYTAYGPKIDPEDMSDDGYSDASIRVEMWHEWIDDARYNVAHIWIAHPSQLRTALYNDTMKKNNYISAIAEQKNAVVAIGGEYLSYNIGSYSIRMGQTLRKKGYRERDALFIDQNGDFHITRGFKKDSLTELEEQGLQTVNLFNFGPALIIDSDPVYDDLRTRQYAVGDPQNDEPRTAIGQIGPLEYLLVVVDGRSVRITEEDGTVRASRGDSLYDVGKYMLAHGCTQAYALDGGGSAAMYYGKTGYYSKPSSKRAVTDIIYFAALPTASQAASEE